MIERNFVDIVVQNMGLNDTVEKVSPNETELPVDSDCCTTSEVPCLWLVMRKTWVGVLQISDGNCSLLVWAIEVPMFDSFKTYQASG